MEDPGGSNRWLHHRWVSIFERLFDDVHELVDVKGGFECVLLGAGTRNPLAFAILVFLAGARKIYVVEPEPIQRVDSWRVLWGLQELASRVLCGNVTSNHFRRDPSEISDFLDLEALFLHREVAECLNPSRVVYFQGLWQKAEVPPDSIDLLTSRSVLEHLIDHELCFDKFADVMKSNGVMYHDVDLTSHSTSDLFGFYHRQQRDEGLNELRLSDYLAHLGNRGFQSEVLSRTQEQDYRLDRSKLDERFGSYSDEDLLCSRAVILSKRRR